MVNSLHYVEYPIWEYKFDPKNLHGNKCNLHIGEP